MDISGAMLAKIMGYLEGTCMPVESALEHFDLPPDEETVEEVDEQLLAMSLEKCPFCGWWCESSELVDEDDEVVGCGQCREVIEDE